ncbi:hypothetical protein CMV14_09050 [Rhizorhabdus dicambivorans]|nr:hypothetical protein CMV14_09050 [Rhizorhabdus dicambivorans]
MPLTLGSPVEGASRPSFHASLDGQAAIVELDSGAVFRLAKQATPGEIAEVLQSKREEIEDAATRLAGDGFITHRDGGVEILITALDL